VSPDTAATQFDNICLLMAVPLTKLTSSWLRSAGGAGPPSDFT